VPVVHSAWMGYRDRLVRGGAEILELKARPDRPQGTSLAQILTGSQSSLHAKTFAVDDERIFIGSFNFDPRSAALNTEMGFLIDSPVIATDLSRALDRLETFYAVSALENGDISWEETRPDGRVITFESEPNTTSFQRGMVAFMSWLPFEWML